jgi:hypothetical protein
VADGDTSFLKVNVWRGQAEHLADSIRARSGHLEDAPTRKTAEAFLMLGSVEPTMRAPHGMYRRWGGPIGSLHCKGYGDATPDLPAAP